jgi:hypothetical protein
MTESVYDEMLKVKGLDKVDEQSILSNCKKIKLPERYKSEDWHKFQIRRGRCGNQFSSR